MKKLLVATIFAHMIMGYFSATENLAPTSTVQSRFEARKERARTRKAVKQEKYEARLTQAKTRQAQKGIVPQAPVADTSTVEPAIESIAKEPVVESVTISDFEQEISTIFEDYVQTDKDLARPIDKDMYDVAWNDSSLANVINQLDAMQTKLDGAINKAKKAKTFKKLDDELQLMTLENIIAFAEDQEGAKAAYKNKLVALANNMSNIKYELFG